LTDKPALPQPIDPFMELAKHNGILWFNGEVTSENCSKWASQMLYQSARDPNKDIIIILNSPGGSVMDGMGLYDLAQAIPNDIAVVGVGLCASMGQFFLTCLGTKGKRFILPHTRVLLHQPLGGVGGTASDVRIQAELIQDMKEQLAGLTASRTGKTVEQVMQDGDRDRWFKAQEALEYGFADHLVTSFSEVFSMIADFNKKEGK
jgi:ATP-dependent Clp protease protease subunit